MKLVANRVLVDPFGNVSRLNLIIPKTLDALKPFLELVRVIGEQCLASLVSNKKISVPHVLGPDVWPVVHDDN